MPLFRRIEVESLAIENLSDGSIAIYDPRTRSVHSLNPSAAVVWEGCAEEVSLAEIAAALQHRFGRQVDDEVVHAAIQQLRIARLISSDEPAPRSPLSLARRSLLRALGAAWPAVLTFSPLPAVLTLSSRPMLAQPQTTPAQTTPAQTTPRPRTTEPRTTEPRTTEARTTPRPRTTEARTNPRPRTTEVRTTPRPRTTEARTTPRPRTPFGPRDEGKPLIKHPAQIGRRK